MFNKLYNKLKELFNYTHNINYEISSHLIELIKSEIRKNNSFEISINDLHKHLWNEFKTTISDKSLIYIMQDVNFKLNNAHIVFYVDMNRCVAGIPFNCKSLKSTNN